MGREKHSLPSIYSTSTCQEKFIAGRSQQQAVYRAEMPSTLLYEAVLVQASVSLPAVTYGTLQEIHQIPLKCYMIVCLHVLIINVWFHCPFVRSWLVLRYNQIISHHTGKIDTLLIVQTFENFSKKFKSYYYIILYHYVIARSQNS